MGTCSTCRLALPSTGLVTPRVRLPLLLILVYLLCCDDARASAGEFDEFLQLCICQAKQVGLLSLVLALPLIGPIEGPVGSQGELEKPQRDLGVKRGSKLTSPVSGSLLISFRKK